MRRRTLVIGAGIAAGLVAGLVAAYGSSAAGRSSEDAGSGVHSTQNPRDVATYWTEERRRNATGG
jgi:phosphodiesterase/alkaline phosphatase D-like protein